MPFGVAMEVLQVKAVQLSRFGMKAAPMLVPVALAGGWFVYPALTDAFKRNPFGIMGDDAEE